MVTTGRAEGAMPRAAKPKSKKKKAAAEAIAPAIELFDLAADPFEKTNLATSYPDKVHDLQARYDAFASQVLEPKSHPPKPSYKVPKVWGEPE